MDQLTALCHWAEQFLSLYDAARGADLAALETQAGVLDAVCQGVLYVLCYRLEHIAVVGGPRALAALRGLPLDKITEHRLQPLLSCAPVISSEYYMRAKGHRLPGRAAAKVAAEYWQLQSAGGVGRRPPPPRRLLETFFPFDPYLLRQSAAYLDLARTYLR